MDGCTSAADAAAGVFTTAACGSAALGVAGPTASPNASLNASAAAADLGDIVAATAGGPVGVPGWFGSAAYAAAGLPLERVRNCICGCCCCWPCGCLLRFTGGGARTFACVLRCCVAVVSVVLLPRSCAARDLLVPHPLPAAAVGDAGATAAAAAVAAAPVLLDPAAGVAPPELLLLPPRLGNAC